MKRNILSVKRNKHICLDLRYFISFCSAHIVSFLVLSPLAISHHPGTRPRGCWKWHQLGQLAPAPKSSVAGAPELQLLLSCRSHILSGRCESRIFTMQHYNKPLLVWTSHSRTMEALFTAAGNAVKLRYLNITQTIWEAESLRKSSGVKMWVRLPCGCCLSSPEYIYNHNRKTAETQLSVHCNLHFNCCHTNRVTMTGPFLLATFFFLFLLGFSPQSQKNSRGDSVACCLCPWAINSITVYRRLNFPPQWPTACTFFKAAVRAQTKITASCQEAKGCIKLNSP